MLRVSEEGSQHHRGGGPPADYALLRQSLLHLQDAADNIFDTISRRVEDENQKLRGIRTRIRNAKEEIQEIAARRQSITIRSLSRYPSISAEDASFKPFFGFGNGDSAEERPFYSIFVNGGLSREYGTDGTLDLFRFFSEVDLEHHHVKRPKDNDDAPQTKKPTSSTILSSPDFPYHSLLVPETRDEPVLPNQQNLPPPPPSLQPGYSHLEEEATWVPQKSPTKGIELLQSVRGFLACR